MASAKIPQPKETDVADGEASLALPQPLVRIPVQHIHPAQTSTDREKDESDVR